MTRHPRRRTPTVRIGPVSMGSGYPVVVQSMTDTPTADVEATTRQIIELAQAGAELVRITINDDASAKAVPTIQQRLNDAGCSVPLIGDFHFNGHILLKNNPTCARILSKYRINPGNVGRGERHDENFATIVGIARDNGKSIRIGVNGGSLDQELLTEVMNENAQRPKPLSSEEVTYQAMIESALRSADQAVKTGLSDDQIVLSVKMSVLQDMVAVYERLAQACDSVLHLGLTEAGGGVDGTVASSAALGILLQQGIGDTIRVSLTPEPGVARTREVDIAKSLLQAMGLRYFQPRVTSCPGCGRTSSDYFQILAREINAHILRSMPQWKQRFPGVEKVKIAVMGCVVNGPGESRHADIGISLPGRSETPVAPVYQDGKQITTLKGENIKEEFLALLEEYLQKRFAGQPSTS